MLILNISNRKEYGMLSIGSTSSLYSLQTTVLSGYSQINNTMASLALSGVEQTQITPSYSSGNTSLSTQSQSFLDGYSTRLTELSSAASEVLNPKTSTTITAGSSDTSITTVSGSLQSENSNYSVEVERLASSQVNSTSEFVATDALPTVGGSLSIQTNSGTFRFSLSSASADTNEDALQQFADEINAADSGVVASVVQRDDNTVALELEGVESDFIASGSFAELTGLADVASAPTEALFTVTDNNTGESQQLTSTTNNINVDGLDITLRGVGSAEITSSQSDGEVIADALSSMVASFNSAVSYIEANQDEGVGALNQLKRMATPPTSLESMESIGVTMNSDGSMSFDRTAFLDAYSSDSDFSVSIAEDIASGVKIDAQRGLSEPSGSLVSNSLSSTSQSSSITSTSTTSFGLYNFSDIDFYNAYSSSGVYNMSNYYAVGAMMNILV